MSDGIWQRTATNVNNIFFEASPTSPAGGNVGIGTAVPTRLLEVMGVSTGANQVLEIAKITNSFSGQMTPGFASILNFGFKDADFNTDVVRIGAVRETQDWQAGITFQTRPMPGAYATRMYIAGSGNVGIGTITPGNPLQVVGSAANSASIYGVTRSAVGGAGVQADNTITGSRGLLAWNGWGVYCFSGSCGGSTGAWQVASDERLKTDIRSIDGALEKIQHLRGVYYRWRNEETNRRDGEKIGLIAQEVEKVFPQAVKTTELPPNSPAALAGGTKILSYSDLIGPVIQAIKELYANWRSDHEQIKRLLRENTAMRAYICSRDSSAAVCSSH